MFLSGELIVSTDHPKKDPIFPTIPGYRILGQLGSGGMATVYLANQETFDREVALKVMAPALAADASYGERFMREARIAARFSHPNIIAVYDVGVHEDHYYIAMEHHPGGDLKGRLANNMTTQQAMSILRQMAAALDYAHSKGYIHRDVKPDNILFREDGSAVLTDFGIARPATGDTQMTQLGMVVGTPKYMSPEQARGQELDARSDIYALGIVFYEMLVGRVPFTGKDAIDIGIKHVKEPVPPLPAQLAALQPLVDRMLAKHAAERYARGRELIAELDTLRMGALRNQKQDYSGPVRAVAADRAVPQSSPLTARRDTLDDTIPPPPAKRRSGLSPLSLLLPALLAALAYYFYTTGDLADVWQEIAGGQNIPQETPSAVQSPTPPAAKAETVANTRSEIDAEVATRLAADSLGEAINHQLYPARPSSAGIADSAAEALADIDISALPAVDNQTRIINEMLRSANKLLSDGQMLAPADNNALDGYRKVLELEPENTSALAGIAAIADHHLALADQALTAGSLEPAAQYLQQAWDIAPDLPAIAERQAQLDQAIAQHQAQVSEARAQVRNTQVTPVETPTPGNSRPDAILNRFKVTGLLRSAQYDMAEGRYTSPPDNSALQKYQAALRLSPGNAEARKAMEELEALLESQLDRAIEAGEIAEAMAILQELKLVNPRSARVIQASTLTLAPKGEKPPAGQELVAPDVEDPEPAATEAPPAQQSSPAIN